MVVKRQCSFCANEIEPGTGMTFVKRDGTVFQFCSGSCRKQQLSLGRVGHRRKWTRAHATKKAAERAGGRAAPPIPPAPSQEAPPVPAAAPPAPGAPAKSPPEPKKGTKEPAPSAGER